MADCTYTWWEKKISDYTPLTGENDWKVVRNAATSANFVMPQDFDLWLESVKAEAVQEYLNEKGKELIDNV